MTLTLLGDKPGGHDVHPPRRRVGPTLLAVGCGFPETAVRLLGAAEIWARVLGTAFLLPERTAYEQATVEARLALGEDRFAAAWAAGQALTHEAAVAEALSGDPLRRDILDSNIAGASSASTVVMAGVRVQN